MIVTKYIINKITALFLTIVLALPYQGFSAVLPYMPETNQIISVGAPYELPKLVGLKFLSDSPFEFIFMLSKGDMPLTRENLQREVDNIGKYFLGALTLPEDDLWVNLSPYEQDRISTEELAQTDLGKDMLGEDYVLKQLVSSVTYPESESGKKFWGDIYKKVKEKLGTAAIPVNTFNKVWIMPDKIRVVEADDRAAIDYAKLKVMMEGDYVALKNSKLQITDSKSSNKDTDAISAQAMREVIIPIIEEEVNTGKHFARLRQIYSAIVMAVWFKKKLAKTILGEVYFDKKKIKGADCGDPQIRQKIYNEYTKAFRDGIYNYIRRDKVPGDNFKTIKRRYVSGGIVGAVSPQEVVSPGSRGEVNRLFAAGGGTPPQAQVRFVGQEEGEAGGVVEGEKKITASNREVRIAAIAQELIMRLSIQVVTRYSGGPERVSEIDRLAERIYDAQAAGDEVDLSGLPRELLEQFDSGSLRVLAMGGEVTHPHSLSDDSGYGTSEVFPPKVSSPGFAPSVIEQPVKGLEEKTKRAKRLFGKMQARTGLVLKRIDAIPGGKIIFKSVDHAGRTFYQVDFNLGLKERRTALSARSFATRMDAARELLIGVAKSSLDNQRAFYEHIGMLRPGVDAGGSEPKYTYTVIIDGLKIETFDDLPGALKKINRVLMVDAITADEIYSTQLAKIDTEAYALHQEYRYRFVLGLIDSEGKIVLGRRLSFHEGVAGPPRFRIHVDDDAPAGADKYSLVEAWEMSDAVLTPLLTALARLNTLSRAEEKTVQRGSAIAPVTGAGEAQNNGGLDFAAADKMENAVKGNGVQLSADKTMAYLLNGKVAGFRLATTKLTF